MDLPVQQIELFDEKMDCDEFMVIIRFLLVTNVIWKALQYMDEIEIKTILLGQTLPTVN